MQKSLEKIASLISAYSRFGFDTGARTTSKFMCLKPRHVKRKRKMEESLCIFSRSRSCGFELPYIKMEESCSFVCKIRSQDVLTTSDSDSHVGSSFVCGGPCISSNCCLDDASPTDTASCFCCLTAHAVPAVDVDIPQDGPHRPVDSLELVTWNLASPNNNPFEFWVRS